MVGGSGPKLLDRVLAYCDERMPNRVPLEELPGRIEELQRRAGEAGRDRIPVGFSGTKPEPETVEQLTKAGVERIIFCVKPEDAGEVERRLDRYVELMAAVP